MASLLVQELSRYIEKRQAILIAGAGITISATADPTNCSWQGLLRQGLERCRQIRTGLNGAWVKAVSDQIESSDPKSLLKGAQEIQTILQGTPGAHFRKWLASTVGKLTPSNPGILKAIADLGIPVATTNYDSLLLHAIGGNPVTWRDPPGIQRIVRGEDPGVVHIHGYWQDPTSVVLGVSSYSTAMGNRRSQRIMRTLFASHSVVFAGFGSGLDDPNFVGLRNWAREVLVDSDFPPTILVRSSEVADAEATYGADRFQVIPYGDAYEDLELFLANLKPRPTPTDTDFSYDWPSIQVMLTRLNRRIRREWDPQLVITMSGAGNFAPYFCMTLDTTETPVINAVTFPKVGGRSAKNLWFKATADSCNWKHFESTKWDVFLPDLLTKLPKGSRILIFDDRVIGGNVQRRVAEWLRNDLGHDVKRAAMVVHPSVETAVDWYEEVRESNFYFPWGGRRGRA